MSPFNIGRRIVLSDFTFDEVAPFASRLNTRTNSSQSSDSQLTTFHFQLLKRVLHWTSGHPYLTQSLFHSLAQSQKKLQLSDVDAHCKALYFDQEAQTRDDNMAFVRNSLLRHSDDVEGILHLYRQALRQKRVIFDATSPLHSKLRLSGVVQIVGGEICVRNQIYRHVFNETWISENMPDAEMRRQKDAYRQGIVRSAAIFGSLAILIATLLFFAVVSARNAENSEKRASHLLYISNMNLIQREWEAGNIAHVPELLDETKSSNEKGFEWGYWNRLSHQSVLSLTAEGNFVSTAFSPDSKSVAALSSSGQLTTWDRASGAIIRKIEIGEGRCTGLSYSPDGKILVAGAENSLHIIDSASERRLAKLIPTGLKQEPTINSFEIVRSRTIPIG